MKKLTLFIFLTLFLAASSFLLIKGVRAGSDHKVEGWAWSENVGWISFNSLNCDADENGLSDGNPPDCPAIGAPITNYGVDVNLTTGLFSGYAWSENVGWISFEQADLAGCPEAPCEARLDTGTKEVSGWARVLATDSSWDGWIKLRSATFLWAKTFGGANYET